VIPQTLDALYRLRA